ncbi:MAG: 50S ribosomal protein L30 [Crocinitomicaceae bacterium]
MATIKIKQVRSGINRRKDQKATLVALGFKRLNQVIEKEDSPQVMGMIKKLHHLVEIVK